jgi:hypothetical protein
MGAENVDDTDWALERIEFINHALNYKHGWCKDDFNWSFGWYPWWSRSRWPWAAKWISRFTGWAARVLLTIKVIICVALDRRQNFGIWGNAVEVAAWDFRPWTSMDFYGTAYDWWILAVGHGWRDWHYDVYETSSA